MLTRAAVWNCWLHWWLHCWRKLLTQTADSYCWFKLLTQTAGSNCWLKLLTQTADSNCWLKQLLQTVSTLSPNQAKIWYATLELQHQTSWQAWKGVISPSQQVARHFSPTTCNYRLVLSLQLVRVVHSTRLICGGSVSIELVWLITWICHVALPVYS